MRFIASLVFRTMLSYAFKKLLERVLKKLPSKVRSAKLEELRGRVKEHVRRQDVRAILCETEKFASELEEECKRRGLN